MKPHEHPSACLPGLNDKGVQGATAGILAAPAQVLTLTLSVVQACLHDMLPQDRSEASKPSLWNCWRPKPPAHAVNEEELDKAAEYVVSRFGVYSDDEEESDNEDEWEGGKVGRLCRRPFIVDS